MNLITSYLEDLVRRILKIYPPYLIRISVCSVCVPWEMGTGLYVNHKMDNIWLCHAAASIAGALQDLAPEMYNSYQLEEPDFIYGCMRTLLRVHSALSSTLEINVWCQVHGVWMAKSKR
jgi:hypothetical protein